MELANEKTNEENLHLFKKVGSNFQIKDRTVLFEPRGAWKNLLDSGIFGGNAFVSRLRRDPISASNSDFQFWRRGRDSNPGRSFPLNTLAVCCFQPLSHLSGFQLSDVSPQLFGLRASHASVYHRPQTLTRRHDFRHDPNRTEKSCIEKRSMLQSSQ